MVDVLEYMMFYLLRAVKCRVIYDELDVPNLHVIKAMQSLTLKGLAKTQFSSQYYYYLQG